MLKVKAQLQALPELNFPLVELKEENLNCPEYAYHFSIPSDHDILISMSVMFFAGTNYVLWDGFLAFLTTLRVFESRNEDVVRLITLTSALMSSSFLEQSLKLSSPNISSLELIDNSKSSLLPQSDISYLKIQKVLSLGDIAVGDVKEGSFSIINKSENCYFHYVAIASTKNVKNGKF